MVGNSVPVQLAYVLGCSILNQFELYSNKQYEYLDMIKESKKKNVKLSVLQTD